MIYRERINGITKHSLKYFEKHIDKIGKIQSITAYHIVSSKQGCKQANVRISIKGINGTIVLGGLSWGYHGEGSRGLSQVFHKCSISDIIPFTNVLGVFNWNSKKKTNSRLLLWSISISKNKTVITIKHNQIKDIVK